MCVPTKKKRKAQAQVARGEEAVKPLPEERKPPVREAWIDDEPVLRLNGDEAGDIAIDCCQLVRLTVTGAEPGLHDGRHWAVLDDACVITVQAVTEPDSAGAWRHLGWGGAVSRNANRETVVSRAAPLNAHAVTASLRGAPQTATIEVVDLLSLSAPQLQVLADRPRHWKAYASNQPARLKAAVTGDEAWFGAQLRWQGATAVLPFDADVDLTWPPLKVADSTPEERAVTVTLGTVCPKSLTGHVRVCRWPELRLAEVKFDGFPASNDGVNENGALFDSSWLPARPDPAAHQAAALSQGPLVYIGGDHISLAAWFDVVVAPSEPETVRIHGSATHNGVTMTWQADVLVRPGDARVTVTTRASSLPLGIGVDATTLQTDWTMDTPDRLQQPHLAIGSSRNPLYVLLGAPNFPDADNRLYWTLLDLSCRAAAGTTTENAFVPAAFAPLVGSVGDGNGIPRKGDGARLTYYRDGVDTPTTDAVYVTFDILGSAQATARCGGWFDLFRHMLAMHGVACREVACVRMSPNNVDDYSLRFHAATNVCAGLAANALAAPYMNLHSEINPDPNVRGQGKDFPQFEFGDHVVAWHNGQVYDPSYGLQVAAALTGLGKPDMLAYEQQAIGGFGAKHTGHHRRQSSDGTWQKFAHKIGTTCLIVHRCTLGQTLRQVAAQHGLRVYNQIPLLAQRITLLHTALQLAGYGEGPHAAGTEIIIKQPRSQVVLKWTFT